MKQQNSPHYRSRGHRAMHSFETSEEQAQALAAFCSEHGLSKSEVIRHGLELVMAEHSSGKQEA